MTCIMTAFAWILRWGSTVSLGAKPEANMIGTRIQGRVGGEESKGGTADIAAPLAGHSRETVGRFLPVQWGGMEWSRDRK